MSRLKLHYKYNYEITSAPMYWGKHSSCIIIFVTKSTKFHAYRIEFVPSKGASSSERFTNHCPCGAYDVPIRTCS